MPRTAITLFVIASLTITVVACGPSAEERRRAEAEAKLAEAQLAELERQATEREAAEAAAQENLAKQTAADVYSISTAIEGFAVDNSRYPGQEIAGMDGRTQNGSNWTEPDILSFFLSPTYIRRLPVRDGWNNVIRIAVTDKSYTVVAPGPDGSIGTADDIYRGTASNYKPAVGAEHGFVFEPSH